MKKVRFYLSILMPWCVAWGMVLFLLLKFSPVDTLAKERIEMIKSLNDINDLMNEVDILLYSTHIDSQVVILDDNTDRDVVKLGELSNQLASASNGLTERVQMARQAIGEKWLRSALPRRGLDDLLDSQYEKAIRHVDEYIAYLTHVIDILDNSDGNSDNLLEVDALGNILVEMNKTTMRCHQRLELITTRVAILEREQFNQQYDSLEAYSDSKRLFLIIICNLFFLGVVLLTAYKLRHYSTTYQKLNNDVAHGKEDNAIIKVLQNKIETLLGENQKIGQQLALTKLYQENLANNIRLGMIMVGNNWELLSYNHAAATLLGLNDDNLHQKIKALSWWKRLDRPQQLSLAISEVEREKRVKKVDTIIMENSDGEKRSIDLVISPFMSETGRTTGIVILMDDVTAAINMRERLMENERLATVGRLAAQVAHEIRNPLSSIGLNSDLLSDEIGCDGDPAEARALLRSIQKEVGRLSEVTERYLNLARPSKPLPVVCNINQIVQETISFCAQELRKNNVELQLRLGSEPLLITADAGQLHQALLNILRNGWEAMPNGGTIFISSFKRDEEIVLQISDSGPGVEPKLRQTIFDPFYTTKGQGNGLGLSITSQLLQDNNGTIEYRELEGYGATFEIRF